MKLIIDLFLFFVIIFLGPQMTNIFFAIIYGFCIGFLVPFVTSTLIEGIKNNEND